MATTRAALVFINFVHALPMHVSDVSVTMEVPPGGLVRGRSSLHERQAGAHESRKHLARRTKRDGVVQIAIGAQDAAPTIVTTQEQASAVPSLGRSAMVETDRMPSSLENLFMKDDDLKAIRVGHWYALSLFMVRAARASSSYAGIGAGVAVFVGIGVVLYTRMNSNVAATDDEAAKKLLTDAAAALKETKENEQWQSIIDSFRKHRGEDAFDKDPSDLSFTKCCEQAEVHDQMKALFTELSGGEDLLKKEQLELLCKNMWCTKRNLITDTSEVLEPFAAEDYQWLMETVEQPISKKEFVAILQLLAKVRMDLQNMKKKKKKSNAQSGDEPNDGCEMHVWVQIGDNIPYHVRYGWQDKDGETAFYSEACKDQESDDDAEGTASASAKPEMQRGGSAVSTSW